MTFREVTANRAVEWIARGHRRRHFFAHAVHHLPKCGPDGFLLAQRMRGADDPEAMWELVLYADPALLAEFPRDLFFDDDVVWHQQQFGRPGQVATASLVVDGSTVHALTLVSDLVQRISRRREHKTRVEKAFKGWAHMLLNAVVGFAAERGIRQVRVASADLAHRHTDRARQADRAIFDRIYDHTVNDMFPAHREGEWWAVEVDRARPRMLAGYRRTEARPRRKAICVFHDVERGLGHADVDPAFADRADETSPRSLATMRAIEVDLGVRTTYCVVGSLLSEVRDGLEADGQCLAFHSFDHCRDRDGQLQRCREVDYRLKGYRLPNSRPTAELTDRNLLFHNFEWLASSSRSLGADSPQTRAGLVRIPVTVDDYPFYTRALSYAEWERRVLRLAAERDFVAIGLHDCYAPGWLDRYSGLLERLAELGELRTLDEVAADVTLSSAA
ncbi:MAG: hypothetical protein M3155_02025 [Actinomycetota bacterium]|nr:hypothetical protein [Actinomycetota bacterium]